MHTRTVAFLVFSLGIPIPLPAQTAADTSSILEYLTPQLLLDRAAPGVPGHLAVLHLPAELDGLRATISARLGPLCMNGLPADTAPGTTEVWVGLSITRETAQLHVHHVVPMPGGSGDYSLGYGFVKDSAGRWTTTGLGGGIGDGFGGASTTTIPQLPCVGGPSG